ncbi:MAG TPA: Gfo/Idh/MocA family oxidoreductase [Planctomycetota bacterium]|nr:Gfo/Idh/MocA family oxidoreductase [Planctomycetota bacterium]
MRTALIGAGRLGKIHGRILGELGQSKLVAVCDPDEKAAREAAGKSGARIFPDHRAMLAALSGAERPEAAVVAAPTTMHHAVARDLLAAGMHCLVEKPITKTVAEGEELVRLAAERKLALAVGHVERYNPAMIGARPFVHDVKFIEVRRVSPYPFRSVDVGVTMDLMIHDIDLILDLVGQPLESVHAVGAKVLSPSEDIANARLVFEGGAVADVTASRVSHKAERKFRVFQGDAYISIDMLEKSAVVYRKSQALLRGEIDPTKINPTLLGIDIKAFVFSKLIDVQKPSIPKVEPLRAELEDFLAAAAAGQEPPVSGRQGLAALRAAEMILRDMKVL